MQCVCLSNVAPCQAVDNFRSLRRVQDRMHTVYFSKAKADAIACVTTRHLLGANLF